MDFTEQEIERFTKAKELEAAWMPQVGDWFYKADGLGAGSWLICRIAGGILLCAGEAMKKPQFAGRLVEFREPQNYTWIPSLERLFTMALDSPADGKEIGRILIDFTEQEADDEISEYVARVRLLLLSMVMWKRYARKWNGKIWKVRGKVDK